MANPDLERWERALRCEIRRRPRVQMAQLPTPIEALQLAVKEGLLRNFKRGAWIAKIGIEKGEAPSFQYWFCCSGQAGARN